MTARDHEQQRQWRERARNEHRARLRCAHPAELVACGYCGGLGEIPHEDDARECPACCGVGVELAEMPPPRDEDAPAELVETATRARMTAWGRAA